ncbi:prepilin-type N-terminal cleavage/methylation domain-containing protein [Aquabacterium soli]|uniref:Prepilin-type N-terminal cleavage/methylation domain-containing protein n=1 Tax=Aquabacterium soli TaxID=2493092 RepID=A0A426V8B6_9BURK|nr:prepilin-type N-terminal cleavage/methylation domain-containing protein [Aquabacterium soli]RRS03092.1 prepilin-type N-terminal cleavage/methylation domain-containing protein [Aquabacterium soli]
MSRAWRTPTRAARGFTLVELVIVIVITAIVAVSVALVVRPALDAYIDAKGRADVSDQSDLALRRMLRDVRQAVPNSIRIPETRCFELVPTSGGGRYRMDKDIVKDAGCTGTGCSAPVDSSAVTSAFDSLTPLSATPSAGDWVVINNQNTGDVYSGVNRSDLMAVPTAPAAAEAWQGRMRLAINPKQFPTGYDGGRFLIVPNNQKAVFYVCSGADGSVDANGDGKGTLFRVRNYGFNAAYPSSCPSTTGADVLARRLKSCTFVYDANAGATQQSGYIWLTLEVSRNHETASLAVGAHVMNTP